MRTKKSELRLYCDLLMQQVHSVKQSITQKGDGEQMAVPDVAVMFWHFTLLSDLYYSAAHCAIKHCSYPY